ncbi:uncharacterized protein [Euwallacea fornicatus]|uniref:uncharacterized protein n=1 Tax=Euwallacea fornicatus TaxID=995702 RepID=UPI00338DB63F
MPLSCGDAAQEVTRKLHLQGITNCKDSKNYSMDWGDFSLKPGPRTNDFLFSIRITVLKEVTHFGMEFNLWKCGSESWDSCEYFLRGYKINDMCPYLPKKHQFWSTFVQSIAPPLLCPIKPAVYKANKVPLFTDYWTFLPVQQRFIRARLLGFDGNETVSCVDVEVSFKRENHA